MFTTLFPIAVVVALLCCGIVHGLYVKYRFHKIFYEVANVHRTIYQLKATYSYLLLVWMYLMLPGVSTAIFTMLNSPANADPNDADPDRPNFYLTADLRISTESEQYKFGRRWAISMIFIYPLVRRISTL